jgi:F1F0 ATPase subunit 2
MNEALILVLSWLAGGGLGAVFFAGLWWTVRRGISSPRPQLWFLGSMLLRMSIVLAGFYFVGRGQWQRLLLCLTGFVMMRFIVMRQTQTSGDEATRPKRGASRAP